MTWIFVTMIIVCAGYLTHMIIGFLYRLNTLRPRIELLEQEITEQEAEGDKYEMAIIETEQKTGALEVEVLKYEWKISELQIRINAQTKKGAGARAPVQGNQDVQPKVR